MEEVAYPAEEKTKLLMGMSCMDVGLIVDLETTGLDPERDAIIEIGLLEFLVEDGQQPVIIRTYGAVEDPGMEISEEVIRITGLKPGHLEGRRIDWQSVRGYFERASIVIAHNAEFDRSFLAKRPELKGLNMHWACSMRHIDWRKHHCSTQSLNYLAADHGFINPFAHRAVFDCATTFRLICPYLDELAARSYEREYLVRAVGSPFETKDILKARGYRWDGAERCWQKVVTEAELEEEREFLRCKVYRGQGEHLENVMQPCLDLTF